VGGDALEPARPGPRLWAESPSGLPHWRACARPPQRPETCTRSTDPRFLEKVRDIVGLSLEPPARAWVLGVDEKAQIQALDRPPPVVPLRPGPAERRRHTPSVRHGTTALCAALDVKTGQVLGEGPRRPRAREFRKVLQRLEAHVPGDLEIPLIVDHDGTHQTPAIRRWLTPRPRSHVPFTPTRASWRHLVERWGARLPARPLRRGGLAAPARWKPP